MTDLSPAALAVLGAIQDELDATAEITPRSGSVAAAALRAAVLESLPKFSNGDDRKPYALIMAIAAELAQSEPEFTATPTHKQRRLMTSRFDRCIGNTPDEWRSPLADVVDTADAVRLAMEDWGIESPELLLGLTQLVLHRFDAAKARSDAH